MDDAKQITFVELMTVDIVRKHILKYVVKLSDIENLAKMCKFLCLTIRGDTIGRDIIRLRDYQFLNVICKRSFKNACEHPILERVNIIKENYVCKEFEERNRHYEETIITGNQTFFTIKRNIGTYAPVKCDSLAQKIAEEFMLNHQSRDDVETLHF